MVLRIDKNVCSTFLNGIDKDVVDTISMKYRKPLDQLNIETAIGMPIIKG
jgi:hypothetical protein